MTEPTNARTTAHATFAIERRYAQPPARVFAAFAERESKLRWFASAPGFTTDEYIFDFRIGGRESWRGRHTASAAEIRNETMFRDIVPGERIICVYDMFVAGARISVSLLTLEFKPLGEFKPGGSGTLLVLTEQDAFLDGYEDAGAREHGTRAMLDRLDDEVRR
jgi:uncharacterized protein YndB with AHSA1/START domain